MRASRTDVLSGSVLATLARIGVSREDMLAVARPCPGTWSRWGMEEASSFDYLATPQGAAWAVDRSHFDDLLKRRATAAGVTRTAGGGDPHWRILAAGRLVETAAAHDRLIALVAMCDTADSPEPIDARLMIEATPDGWAYGVLGPGRRLCLSIISDAEALASRRRELFFAEVLSRTERIFQLSRRYGGPVSVAATPLPCRFLPLCANERSVRIGDAQASFDPIAGRGLWQAIRSAEDVAIAVDEEPERLALIGHRMEESYRRYLSTRQDFYRAGYERFRTAFWSRRLVTQ